MIAFTLVSIETGRQKMEENKHNLFNFKFVRYRNILTVPELAIGKGITTFFGPSGSGKTTILKLLNRMISPTEGQIFYNGTALADTNPVEHRRKVVMLSQHPVMFEGSIEDNLSAAFRFQKRASPSRDAISDVLKNVRLDKDPGSPVGKLSGGEKQRLALARVVLLEPEVYLLDEPSSALDDDSADIIIETLHQKVNADAKSMIMVTHSKAIARKYSDVFIRVANGRITDREVCNERCS